MAYTTANIAGAVSQADADNQRARLSDLQLRQGEQNLAQGSRVADLQLEGAQMDMQAKKRGEALKQIEISGKFAEQVLASGGKNYPDFVSAMQQLGVPADKLPPQYDPATMQSFVDKSKAFLTSEYEQVQGPRGALLQRHKPTGKLDQVVPPEQQKDWQNPAYIDAMRKINEAKNEGKSMSPTAQKELFEADESAQSASSVISMLGKAKEINKSAMSGPYATMRAKGLSILPGENDAANKTIDLDNIMTGQALESLKLVFGGMPTEGERKILLDMQASTDKTPAQRETILNRAIEMANRRLAFNKSKADSLRSGSYFKEGPQTSTTNTASPSQPSRITNDAEYNALPSGTTFVGPDGVPRRKP